MRALLLTPLLALAGCVLLDEAPRPVDAIPFTYTDDGRILVELAINEAGPFTFVLDTASGATLVKRDVATALGLEYQGFDVAILGLASVLELPAYAPARVDFGGRPVELPWILVHDIDQAGAEGVLGVDLLRRYAVEIDGPGRVIYLYTDNFEPDPRTDTAASADMLDTPYGLAFVAYEVNGAEGVALIDTGVGGMIIEPEFALAAQVRTRRTEDQLADVANETTALLREGRGTVEVSGATWARTPVVLARPMIFDHLAEMNLTALLGGQVFAGARLVLDFPERRVFIILERGGVVILDEPASRLR